MSYNKICAALDTEMLAFESVNIAFPDQQFNPDGQTGWLKIDHLFVPVTAAAIGSEAADLVQGIYQITVHEKNLYGAWNKVDQIRQHFSRGEKLVFGDVTVTIGNRSAATPASSPTWIRIPVSINWKSYTSA